MEANTFAGSLCHIVLVCVFRYVYACERVREVRQFVSAQGIVALKSKSELRL